MVNISVEEWTNTVAVIIIDILVWVFIGFPALVYLTLCLIVGHSFHPVAAHFIHEHYMFADG